MKEDEARAGGGVCGEGGEQRKQQVQRLRQDMLLQPDGPCGWSHMSKYSSLGKESDP